LQFQALINVNQQAIKDAEALLCSISDSQYKAVVAPFTASLGKHLRHITDHYHQFFAGMDTAAVDYDARNRDTLSESERSAMILNLRQVQQKLKQLGESDEIPTTIELIQSVDTQGAAPSVTSNVERELVFLQSHATHHFVIIAAILKLQGITVDDSFGVAPSTLKYEQQQCAH